METNGSVSRVEERERKKKRREGQKQIGEAE